jgi:hypothetical protein
MDITIASVTVHCMASVSRCVQEGVDHHSIAIMKAEIRRVAREVSRWRLSGEAKARLFLRPMENQLVCEYGSHFGRRLYWDFIDAFWLQSWSDSDLVDSARGSASGFSPEYHTQTHKVKPDRFIDEEAAVRNCPGLN